jgi:hypothetical protein
MSYATFVTFRDGLILNYREYWNPMAFTAAMAGTRFDNSGQIGLSADMSLVNLQ